MAEVKCIDSDERQENMYLDFFFGDGKPWLCFELDEAHCFYADLEDVLKGAVVSVDLSDEDSQVHIAVKLLREYADKIESRIKGHVDDTNVVDIGGDE